MEFHHVHTSEISKSGQVQLRILYVARVCDEQNTALLFVLHLNLSL